MMAFLLLNIIIVPIEIEGNSLNSKPKYDISTIQTLFLVYLTFKYSSEKHCTPYYLKARLHGIKTIVLCFSLIIETSRVCFEDAILQ